MNSKTTTEWRFCFIDNQKERFMGSQDAWMLFNPENTTGADSVSGIHLAYHLGSVIFLLWALVFCL